MESPGFEVKAAPSTGKKIRLLFDARKLGHGGIGTYSRSLIENLSLTGAVELTLLLRDAASAAELGCAPLAHVIDPSPPYSWDETFRLARRIPFEKFDLFHTPHYVLPKHVPIPAVITVHDTIHITHPEKFYYPWIARLLLTSALRRASGVITVSNSSKSAILDIAPAAGAKITVVPNTLDSTLATINSPALPAGLKSCAYLLSVISMDKPHKGLSDLLHVYRGLSGQQMKLVIAGQGAPRQGEDDDVLFLGKVERSTLAALYRNAAALVVPSRAEGFCLPVLEAKSFGTPVIARPVPAVLELLEQDDVVAADFSLSALAAALKAFQARKAARRDHSAFLRRFSAERNITAVLEVYRRALTARTAEVNL